MTSKYIEESIRELRALGFTPVINQDIEYWTVTLFWQDRAKKPISREHINLETALDHALHTARGLRMMDMQFRG